MMRNNKRMSDEKVYPNWIKRMKERLGKLNVPSKLIFILVGVASSIWFLIRVIPKPSRAGYPCMKVAAPFMSSFVIYLLTISGSILFFKKARQKLMQAKYVTGILFLLAAFTSGGIFMVKRAELAQAKTNDTEDLTANSPMGTAQGILPGRVVWIHETNATNELCTNDPGDAADTTDDDGYFLPKNNDMDYIHAMTSEAVMRLSGKSTVAEAWDTIFRYFNHKKHGTNLSYSNDEIVFIKINTTSASWAANKTTLNWPPESYASWKWDNYGVSETTPATMLSILTHLVDTVGVPQENIFIGDPISFVWQYMYNLCTERYPDVNYIEGDHDGTRSGHESIGRYSLSASSSSGITYSDGGSIMGSANSDKFYLEMENADYLINLAALKGHERAGITLLAKNHFGSHTRDGASHLHPGLVAPDFTPTRTSYGMYRVQVDIMGCDYLGGNTLLHLVDGLWGGPHDTKQPVKWQMPPFNNDWPNSIFVSFDQVAIESVCFDLLRTEFDGSYNYRNKGYFLNDNDGTFDFPNYAATDDYLEQAADPSNWPGGVTYSPNGTTLTSLGTHEHWNNSTDMQYSRNLSSGSGIYLDKVTGVTPVDYYSEPSDTSDPGPNPTYIANRDNGEMNIYPSPATQKISVSYQDSHLGLTTINVIDFSGRLMNSLKNDKSSEKFESSINISDLSKGTYILEIVSGNNLYRKTFIKAE